MNPAFFRPARVIAAAALLLAACAPSTAPVQTGPAPAGGAPLDELYARAIAEAAVYAPEHVLPLFPAVPDADGNVRVVTLTSWNYAPGAQELGRDIWVTVVPEVRDSCGSWSDRDRVMRLRQLLGLRPGDSVAHFVEMTVPVAAMFRPTVDPAVTTRWPCPEGAADGQCGLRFPAAADSAHIAWMANQMLASWQTPDAYPADTASARPRGRLGYPWTRLGYTFNWHPGAPRYGASEYLVRGGARITVAATYSVPAYCGGG